MELNINTNIKFTISRDSVDETLYVIKDSLEYEYNIEINDDRYERILFEVMQMEPDFDDPRSFFHDAYNDLSSVVEDYDFSQILYNAYDVCVTDNIREAYDKLIELMIERTVEVMIDAGDFE